MSGDEGNVVAVGASRVSVCNERVRRARRTREAVIWLLCAKPKTPRAYAPGARYSYLARTAIRRSPRCRRRATRAVCSARATAARVLPNLQPRSLMVNVPEFIFWKTLWVTSAFCASDLSAHRPCWP